MKEQGIRGLPGYLVRHVDEGAKALVIDADVKLEVMPCPHCDSDQVVGFGRRHRTVIDRPTRGRSVQIQLTVRRLQCKACSRTFCEMLPGVNEKRFMTDRLVKWIVAQAAKRTYVSIASEIGVAESTIRSICRDFPDLDRPRGRQRV
ncbi:transposase family protein [Burkholderia gladioli]|uniref:transposase family protein n=1 Tax=Burkholderia gladioli TaxID=28095 RepID=UPI001641DB39|nr:transposase family protein [Burkholderia gladioli]